MRAIRGPALLGGARRELIGGWASAIIAVVAVAGIVQASEGTEYAIWYLAPVMFLASASALWLGLRARRDGEEGGVWPASIGLVIGGFFVLNLLLALVGDLIGFE